MTQHEQTFIHENKIFFEKLKEVEELYFSTLSDELNFNDKGRDWLFDYLHNCPNDEPFEMYIGARGKTIEDMRN